MLSLIQILSKNDLMKPGEVIYLEKLFNEYAIDHRTVNYGDLKSLFKDPKGFIVKKFELDKRVPEKELEKFIGKKAAPPTRPSGRLITEGEEPKPEYQKPAIESAGTGPPAYKKSYSKKKKS
jgi:hypothetical protein